MKEITPKFLTCVNEEEKELYILHRQFPACLIQVVQETPVRFVIQDLYDEVEDTNEILKMPFLKEAKEYYRNLVKED